MSDTVIREVTKNVWTFSRPFARFGLIPIGGRSTAIRLKQGHVWVLASTPLNPETKQKLDEIGPVKYIIAPDLEHSMFISQFKQQYPDAKVIGVEPLLKKPGLEVKFDGAYGADPEGTKYGYEDEISSCYFSGFVNKDVAFLHTESKTLIEADLLFNLPATEQFSKVGTSWFRSAFNNLNMTPSSSLQKRLLWSTGTDKDAMRRDAKTVSGWDFERIIPCHGDVVEKDAKKAWENAYHWFLN